MSLLALVGGAALLVVGLYCAFTAAMMFPWLQHHMLFLNVLNFPWKPKFHEPEWYGISSQKARNLRIESTKNARLGAWHLLPDDYYRRVLPSFASPRLGEEVYDRALVERPVVIYLHGNGLNRAMGFRVASYKQLTAGLDANVVVVDYRGFGDSQGRPTEGDVVDDAEATWRWVVDRRRMAGLGRDQAVRNVILVGQSLGTGIAAQLALRLCARGCSPEAMWLVAPYVSIAKVALGFRLFGKFELFYPYTFFPAVKDMFIRRLSFSFNTYEALRRIYYAPQDELEQDAADGDATPGGAPAPAPVGSLEARGRRPHLILSHSTKDDVILYRHSEALFDVVLREKLGRYAPGADPMPDVEPTTDAARAAAAAAEPRWAKERAAHVELRTPQVGGRRKWVRVEQFAAWDEEWGARRGESRRPSTASVLSDTKTSLAAAPAAAAAAAAARGRPSPSVTMIRSEIDVHDLVTDATCDIALEVLRGAVVKVGSA